MENMEYIDDYFKGSPTDLQKQQFERRIINDNVFAEEVAFYISANRVVKEQLLMDKKQRFREIYEQHKVVPITKQPVKKIWRYMVAASVIAAVVLSTWFLLGENTSPQQLADRYIQQNFQTLSVTMGSKDSLQYILNLVNSGKLSEALTRLETLAQIDPSNKNATKYAGIVSLRLNQYDKALTYFSMLASDTSLYSNHGKFYEAVTLLKRNKTGDVEEAKKKLQEVVENEQEGKEEAIKWLKKLD
ncbi:MAG: hypothetical protein H7Z13_19590 [Ferruginibacter sp.]|nr:hypothetical protein [Ferruginibacter sp.]